VDIAAQDIRRRGAANNMDVGERGEVVGGQARIARDKQPVVDRRIVGPGDGDASIAWCELQSSGWWWRLVARAATCSQRGQCKQRGRNMLESNHHPSKACSAALRSAAANDITGSQSYRPSRTMVVPGLRCTNEG